MGSTMGGMSEGQNVGARFNARQGGLHECGFCFLMAGQDYKNGS